MNFNFKLVTKLDNCLKFNNNDINNKYNLSLLDKLKNTNLIQRKIEFLNFNQIELIEYTKIPLDNQEDNKEDNSISGRNTSSFHEDNDDFGFNDLIFNTDYKLITNIINNYQVLVVYNSNINKTKKGKINNIPNIIGSIGVSRFIESDELEEVLIDKLREIGLIKKINIKSQASKLI